MEPDIFDVLERTPYSERGELELTDAIKRMSKDKVVYAYEISGRWYTVGDRLSYLKTTVEFALMREELRGPFWEYLRELTDGGKDVEP